MVRTTTNLVRILAIAGMMMGTSAFFGNNDKYTWQDAVWSGTDPNRDRRVSPTSSVDSRR